MFSYGSPPAEAAAGMDPQRMLMEEDADAAMVTLGLLREEAIEAGLAGMRRTARSRGVRGEAPAAAGEGAALK